MQPKISVIVPIYKAEKYLHRCIESILAQTFTDFELILVDDGSPDNCGTICDEYAQKEKRIKVIHKENGGVNAARADGVKFSSGEFITFVDSDDTIPKSALKDLLIAMSDNTDIVIGGYTRTTGGIKLYDNSCLHIDEYREETLICKHIHTGPFSKLFRKELFDDKTFDIPREIYMGEDLIMNIRLAFAANKDIKTISKSVYNYRDDNLENCCNNFKFTLEYESLHYIYYKESIPTHLQNKYIGATIDYRLKRLRIAHKYYIEHNIWHIAPFHKELMNDIKASKHKISLIKRVALSCHNPITCYIYKNLTKIIGKSMKLS